MNNKHIASLLLAGFIIGCIQIGLVMQKKMNTAKEAQSAAEAAYSESQTARTMKDTQLRHHKQETASLRQYLALWMAKITETNDETKARAAFTRVLKQHGEGLISHADRSNIVPNKDSPFFPKRYQNILSVEGDFAHAIGLIGQIERLMPASRISSLSVAKGTRGNDIKLSFTVETPLMAKVETPAKKT